MMNTDKFIKLLETELMPAMGCTEPIAICYAGAKAREVLGAFPDKIYLRCSGSLYKNAKGVRIPNTNGLMGVRTSAIIGTIGGDAKKELEVLENVTDDDIKKALELLETDFCKVELLEGGNNVHIILEAFLNDESVLVEIIDKHTNIVRIEKNGEVLYKKECTSECSSKNVISSFDEILEFVETVDISKVENLIQSQIDLNLELSNEALFNNYGVGIGKIILDDANGNLLQMAKAYTIGACDARMHGVPKPAMSIGGSGTQGITVSIPIYVYGTEKGCSREKIIRAILLSDLTYLYIKCDIGRLSAFCSAVVSSASSGAGLMYLESSDIKKIQATIINTLGNVSGILCDGAKFSCALKVSSSLDAAYLGLNMAKLGISLSYDTGIISDDFEKTIKNLGPLVKEGMCSTNEKMICLMYKD